MLYVEDPGAANFVAPLPAALDEVGFAAVLFAEGAAVNQLRHLGCAHANAADAISALSGAVGLVVGTSENPDSRAHTLVEAARREGIASFGAVDAFVNAGHRFRGHGDNPLQHAPDRLLVPDQSTADAFGALGFPEDRIAVVGHPHFGRVTRERARLESIGRGNLRRRLYPDADPSARIVVFLAETSDGLDPAEFRRTAGYTLTGWGDDDRRTHVVLQEVIDALGDETERNYFVLRLHPKNDADEFARYGDHIDRLSRDESAHEVVFAADIVIGMSTMLLAEAAALGAPVISVLPRENEWEWLPETIRNCVPLAFTRSDVGTAIQTLPGPDEKRPSTAFDFGQGTSAAEFVRSVLTRDLPC